MHADKDYYLKSTDGKTPFLTVSTQPAALEKEDGRHQQLSHMQTPFLCQTRLCRKQTFILCWVWIEQYGFIRKTFSQTGEEKKRKKKKSLLTSVHVRVQQDAGVRSGQTSSTVTLNTKTHADLMFYYKEKINALLWGPQCYSSIISRTTFSRKGLSFYNNLRFLALMPAAPVPPRPRPGVAGPAGNTRKRGIKTCFFFISYILGLQYIRTQVWSGHIASPHVYIIIIALWLHILS